ncbi:MAG: MarR family transcriptional regulator [Lachnospiraceae bacterium]|nr:MarR family transcriptional regulator [Lachnospiraceae bacterium]
MADKYDSLKLSHQLCFPLYAASKEIVRRYKPYLDEINLTYTQYIAMLVLWEHDRLNVKELGQYLYLDSGTLTPLLKKLEEKGYISRQRNEKDERNVEIALTDNGYKLRDEALKVPQAMAGCIKLTKEEAAVMYKLLYGLLEGYGELDKA